MLCCGHKIHLSSIGVLGRVTLVQSYSQVTGRWWWWVGWGVLWWKHKLTITHIWYIENRYLHPNGSHLHIQWKKHRNECLFWELQFNPIHFITIQNRFTLIPAWLCPVKCRMKLLIQSWMSKLQPIKLGLIRNFIPHYKMYVIGWPWWIIVHPS